MPSVTVIMVAGAVVSQSSIVIVTVNGDVAVEDVETEEAELDDGIDDMLIVVDEVDEVVVVVEVVTPP